MKSIKFLAVALVAMVAFAACSKEKSAELVLDRTSLYFTAWGDPAQRVRYVARDADGGVAIASLSPGWNASMDYATQSILVWPEGAPEEGVPMDQEAYDFWKKYLPEDHIILGNKHGGDMGWTRKPRISAGGKRTCASRDILRREVCATDDTW